jgi:glutathione S-transferase
MNPSTTLVLHGVKLSGHVHRVELLLRILGLPYEFVDAPAAVRAGAEFTKLNPLGQIPLLQDGELVLSDSIAIMIYLCKRYAPGSELLPDDALGAAAVQRWLSLAAGEVAFGPAKARAATLWGSTHDIPRAQAIAGRLLVFMEQHLATRSFLAAAHATLADLACYAYVAHAPEGGVSLDAYAAVRAWLARVEALPQFVPMPASAPPVAA